MCRPVYVKLAKFHEANTDPSTKFLLKFWFNFNTAASRTASSPSHNGRDVATSATVAAVVAMVQQLHRSLLPSPALHLPLPQQLQRFRGGCAMVQQLQRRGQKLWQMWDIIRHSP